MPVCFAVASATPCIRVSQQEDSAGCPTVEVGGDQDAVFIPAYIDDALVGRTAQRLLIDRHGIMAGGGGQIGGFNRQILVDLELHAASGTSSSCANAAA